MNILPTHFEKQQNFGITDAGEFVDVIYREHRANGFFSALIGRAPCDLHEKRTFTESDVSYQGYLCKRGTWFKTW